MFAVSLNTQILLSERLLVIATVTVPRLLQGVWVDWRGVAVCC